MQPSIATVRWSASLGDSLRSAAEAEPDRVGAFENGIVSFGGAPQGPPASIAAMCVLVFVAAPGTWLVPALQY